ncbi:MAG: formate dehydrogenase accessory sulfurtransferase FdhD [Pseudomonadota bacterium]|nr:formate dehydrogenase accessory sulfurtransferase FdhD [Pseudomonadota bacterium]
MQTVVNLRWTPNGDEAGSRNVPEETPVALTYNRATHAVMMATPADLEDFAVGFSLSEGIVSAPGEIEEFEAVPAESGIELRLTIAPARAATLIQRHRYLAGATGCGLCGMESLAEAVRPSPRVPKGLRVAPPVIAEAIACLPSAQALNLTTRAVHAAGFFRPGTGLIAVREDVGRHNALDKLAGHLARAGVAAETGIVLLTSRISVEMVQKAAVMGAPIIAAVSAPTALALRTAEDAGITLIGIARDDGFEIFTHAGRILTP